MLRRCDNPDCRSWHWSRRGAEKCYREFLAKRPARTAQTPIELSALEMPWQRERLELERQREQRELEEYLRKHIPRDPENVVAHRNGERQLRLREPHHLHALNALTATPAYRLNAQLRTGTAQEVDDELTIVVGFNTYDEFASAAADAFEHLGAGLQLDAPLTVYRGTNTGIHDFRAWEPGSLVADNGYLFAALDQETAEAYMAGREWQRGPETAPALLKLHVHSALVVPWSEERSRDLARTIYPHTFLRRAVAQVVVPPPLNRWRVKSLRVGPNIQVEAVQEQ